MNESAESLGSRSSLKFVLIVLFLFGAVGVWLYLQKDRQSTRNVEALNKAIILKNRSVAELENNQLAVAIEGFRNLVELAPAESLGTQNLAVSLLIQLRTINRAQEAERFSAIQEQLQATLAQWSSIAPQESKLPLVSAYFAETLEDRDTAINQYLNAAELRETTPVPLFLAYELMQQRAEAYPVSVRSDAIATAYARAPDNIAVVINYLRHLAETENPKFSEILSSSRSLFLPLSARVRDTLPKLFDKAEAAVEAGDWSTAQTQLGFSGNLLLAEIAYTNDLNRLHPHPLEFVAQDFSPDFYQDLETSLVSSPAPIKVEFRRETLDLPEQESVLSALTAADLTLDGQPELIVANDTELRVSELPECDSILLAYELPFTVTGITAADLDRDYQSTRDEAFKNMEKGLFDTDLDLLIWGPSGVRLLRNEIQQGETTLSLSDVELPEGMEVLRQISDVRITDLDHDGDLDIAILADSGVSLWSNNGNWSFTDFTPFSHLPDAKIELHQIVAADMDRNVLNDLVIAAESGLFLLENNLHGRYVSRSLEGLTDPISSVAVIDLNRDASWDLLTAGPQGVSFTPGLTLSEGGWKAGDTRVVSEQPAAGLKLWDYNNDGLLDAVAWDNEQLSILSGQLEGGFQTEETLAKSIPGASQLEVIDFDRDGDQDLIVLREGQISVITNEGGNSNQWIDVRLRAEEIAQTPRERCNMHGIGSLLELKAGGLYQCRTVEGPLTHFGLGQQSEADVLRVLWPNGIPHNVISPSTDGLIFEQQQLKGSCPYLYTWDGEKFVFATDCLWASPIGLQFAQGILAPAREWEYLKIPGEQLQPKEGAYVLQMTEELWEAAYYDSVKLMAIDHPADIDVFTNEKVGPAEIAEFQVHTALHKQTPQAVTDQRGRDVLSEVQSQDGVYTKTWDESFTQGLTETHWLELNLGELDNPESIKLFLTGWVFPTDTSLNIAISQNAEMPRPQPPAIQVPDKDGAWKTVSPYVGFPGGKTKTIVLDLTDQFLTDDYRLRLVTNMEIRWDEVFFTVNEPIGKSELTDLTLIAADLHYRGFSKRIPRPHNQPEYFDYQQVTTDALWPPMGGNFTRYGDVTRLIVEGDDLQVVMGAGDEMTIRFQVPEKPLPTGWVRDFILYNIGWDKDADLNTVQGQQVEPLPFRAMKAYPYEPEQSFPETPAHQQFLQEYQTRHQPRPSFRTEIRDWQPNQNSPRD